MRKKVTKHIRRIAEQLPKEVYKAKAYTLKPGFKIGKDTTHEVNHYRRLKRLISKKDFDGFNDYIRGVITRFENSKNNQEEE